MGRHNPHPAAASPANPHLLCLLLSASLHPHTTHSVPCHTLRCRKGNESPHYPLSKKWSSKTQRSTSSGARFLSQMERKTGMYWMYQNDIPICKITDWLLEYESISYLTWKRLNGLRYNDVTVFGWIIIKLNYSNQLAIFVVQYWVNRTTKGLHQHQRFIMYFWSHVI